MIDPARKPVEAQLAKSVVKPATTQSSKACTVGTSTYLEMYLIHIFLFQQLHRNSATLLQ